MLFNYRMKSSYGEILPRDNMIEIRFHGRGGQGAVTAANILVMAAYKVGLWGQAFPFFGAERRGAPVKAFARLSKSRVRVRSMIRHPDVVVVLDPKLPEIVDVYSGIKDGGAVVMNTPGEFKGPKGLRYYLVNATKIALDHGLVLAGWPLVNTAILGALARAIDLPIEAVKEAITEYLGPKVGPKNAEAAEQAFREVVIVE